MLKEEGLPVSTGEREGECNSHPLPSIENDVIEVSGVCERECLCVYACECM